MPRSRSRAAMAEPARPAPMTVTLSNMWAPVPGSGYRAPLAYCSDEGRGERGAAVLRHSGRSAAPGGALAGRASDRRHPPHGAGQRPHGLQGAHRRLPRRDRAGRLHRSPRPRPQRPSTPETWNVETWSSDLHGLLERIGVERPVVLGAGFGCYVALRYAQRWPADVSKLVLSNPNARAVTERMIERYAELGGAKAEASAREFFERPSEMSIAGFLRDCFHRHGAAGLRSAADADADLEPRARDPLDGDRDAHARPAAGLGAIEAPTLVLAGRTTRSTHRPRSRR